MRKRSQKKHQEGVGSEGEEGLEPVVSQKPGGQWL